MTTNRELCRTLEIVKVSFFALAALAGASFAGGVPTANPSPAPVVRTIAGSRLTIAIGDDTSLQVWDSTVGPGFALFKPNCTDTGQTGDAGTLVAIGGNIFGPDFLNHPCGTLAPAFATPWTPVSISPVTGSGSASDPFTVVVVADGGATGLRLTETVSYVDGEDRFEPALAFSNTASGPLTWRTFLAADMALGFNTVLPILHLGAPGAQSALSLGAPFPACLPLPYYALLPTADRYTGRDSNQMWTEILAGQLSNTLEQGCPYSGIATQWTDRTLGPGEGLILRSTSNALSFVNASPTGTPCTSNSHTLCLNENRFSVTAFFTGAPQGLPVQATAVRLTGDTGYFWFFDPANVELVVKVLDGCVVNGNFWAFAGGLTNVGVALEVTDTRTGEIKTYSNALGSAFQPILDSSAFACP